MRRLLNSWQRSIVCCVLCLCAACLSAQDRDQPHVAIPTIQPKALVPLSTTGGYLELSGPEAFGPRVPNVGQYFATVYEIPVANSTTGTTVGAIGSNFNFMNNPLSGVPSIFALASFEEGDFHLKALDFEGSTPDNIDIQDNSTTAAHCSTTTPMST